MIIKTAKAVKELEAFEKERRAEGGGDKKKMFRQLNRCLELIYPAYRRLGRDLGYFTGWR
jgi:hypothetical protein